MITNIAAQNFLSFSNNGVQVSLENLNVLIGINGSGKTNLFRILNIFRSSANGNLLSIFRENEKINEMFWKKNLNKSSEKDNIPITINATIPYKEEKITYELCFTEFEYHFGIVNEIIKYGNRNYSRYSLDEKTSIFYVDDKKIEIKIDMTESILSYIKNPDSYPEITFLNKTFSKIRFYNNFNEYIIRQQQPINQENKYLKEDGSNLALVLNYFRRDPLTKKKVIKYLNVINDEIKDFDVKIEGNYVQLLIDEGEHFILSNYIPSGVLRYLYLLAVLCNSNDTGSIICIEHPEVGLHFNSLLSLAELIKEASIDRQIIITTYSDVLLDIFSDRPQSVIVVEKNTETGTTFRHLKDNEIKLIKDNKFGFRNLWMKGGSRSIEGMTVN